MLRLINFCVVSIVCAWAACAIIGTGDASQVAAGIIGGAIALFVTRLI